MAAIVPLAEYGEFRAWQESQDRERRGQADLEAYARLRWRARKRK